MIEIEKPRIERVEASDSYGKFVVEPLEHGFGQTLGNSLRRVLLSSLPGVAVSSIRIEGIQHEFSAVPGVKGGRCRDHPQPERAFRQAVLRWSQDGVYQRQGSL